MNSFFHYSNNKAIEIIVTIQTLIYNISMYAKSGILFTEYLIKTLYTFSPDVNLEINASPIRLYCCNN